MDDGNHFDFSAHQHQSNDSNGMENIVHGTVKGDIKTLIPEDIAPGTMPAKVWWEKVECMAKEHGMYAGKLLKAGPGENQGDFQMLHDKLIVTRGFDHFMATKIAAAVKNRIYG
jgi:hypothetical protein